MNRLPALDMMEFKMAFPSLSKQRNVAENTNSPRMRQDGEHDKDDPVAAIGAEDTTNTGGKEKVV
jgi:hypothetical protein